MISMRAHIAIISSIVTLGGLVVLAQAQREGPPTAQQLKEAHERDLAIQADEGVNFERAWLDPERGKVFCLAIAPSREAVLRIHERAGHPTGEIYELAVEV